MPEPADDLAALLAAGPLVLDGGLGTLLEAHGHDLRSELWSARLLVEQPAAVRAAHAEFVAAGAQVLTTASYQVSYAGLGAAGFTDAEVDRMLRRSVTVAREAAGDAAVLVAASVGPYGAARADGSEYSGAYGLSVDELREWHRRRLRVLAEAGADLLAIETIPSPAEVEALCAELAEIGMPAWVSVSGASTGFTPESRTEALAAAAATPGVIAVGVNCCPPGDVLPALADLDVDVALLAYPNSGERWDAVVRQWRGDGGLDDALVESWLDAGVRLVGGCCRTTPADIARVAHLVDARPAGA
ncbi:homocysteine S-methyltransferase [Microbacterium terricola]|uniref:Homocysteine S-methyltransferase n=1 Tax=Microbacterium terricola TaxID=344163 RepID=A0ABM8E2S4_9MICO|nr:homocysteine S-methyltransferase [Microbacterium terricola]UYK40199.1 homocysteine S-methyltransferase [Microbacterium terricola]BDV32095.1 homocysteine S-methyltransferase [Microbacterium terricola]